MLAALDEAVARTATAGLDESLAALSRVAVAQQLDRPRLARLLDLEETRLPLDADARHLAAAILDRVEAVLKRGGVPLADDDLKVAAGDLIHIARGLIDGSAAEGTPGSEALQARVLAALRGYLAERVRTASA